MGDLRRRLGRIVSGGQSGADRAALDWAIRHDVPYGGWCPLGGRAEDLTEPPGLLPDYPRPRATSRPDSDARTTLTVRDGDGTLLVILPGTEPSGGTAFTRDEAVRLGRPHLLTDGVEPAVAHAWLETLPDGMTLNVAGPRESKA